MNKTETLERLVKLIECNGYSEKTKPLYSRWVERLFAFSGTKDSPELSTSKAQDYLFYINDQFSYTDRTFNQAVYVLRYLFNTILEIPANTVLPKRKVKKVQRSNYFTNEQMVQVWDNCADPRLKAVIALAAGYGQGWQDAIRHERKDSQDPLRYHDLSYSP